MKRKFYLIPEISITEFSADVVANSGPTDVESFLPDTWTELIGGDLL